MSFVEILVAVVLLGTVVIGVLAALRATIIATTVERDHSKAQQWLQSASGVLGITDFEQCAITSATPTPPEIAAELTRITTAYQTAIRSNATRPEGFDSTSQISVTAVEVWNGVAYVAFSSQAECLDNNDLRQQLVTIAATNNDGSITEDVEVVKRDG